MTHKTPKRMRTRCHNSGKFAMDEKVVYGLFTLLTKTTSVDKNKSQPPQVVNRKDFTPGCCPNEESNRRWSLHLTNALPRKNRRLSIL
jgi:hypothetical protein